MIVGATSFTRTFLGLWKPLSSILLWSISVTAIHEFVPQAQLWVSSLPLTVAGVALGVILTFRNNATYARYWEGRTLWGGLINDCRSMIRQIVTFLRVSPDAADYAEREQFIRESALRIAAFAHALRHHLRGEDSQLELGTLLSGEERERLRRFTNVPTGIVMIFGEELGKARGRGWLDTVATTALDRTLIEFADIQGGCERILNTPLPPVYTHIAHRIVILFCFLLPFGLVTEMKLLTPVMVTMVAFTFLLLSQITLLLENPFGLRANDLPLTAMSRTIEIDVRQSVGITPVPPPVSPDHGVLL
ncbi:MAG: hypothetical protein H7Y38_19040 [Armatimonadetes bacterium]|nr:hypothetical protein [Armatimonadota bacterium]